MTKTKLIPLGDNVIIEPKPAEQETSFGIVLPDSKEKPMEGTIISINDASEKTKKSGLKAGDRVLYKKYSPTEYKESGKEYYILEVEDLLAKIG